MLKCCQQTPTLFHCFTSATIIHMARAGWPGGKPRLPDLNDSAGALLGYPRHPADADVRVGRRAATLKADSGEGASAKCELPHTAISIRLLLSAKRVWVTQSRTSRDPRWCSSPESSDREDAHPSRRCHRAPAGTADPGGDGHRRPGAGRGRSRADPLRLARPARLESPCDDERARIDHKARRGAPIAAPADIVRTDGYALDPARPRAGEQAETIAKHGSRMRIHTEAEATQSAHAIDATALRAQPVLLQRKCACGANASGLTGECAECSKKKMVGLQTKLRINEAGDIYEHEADRVAEQVLAKPARPHVSGAPPRIQRFSGQSSGQTGAAPASVDRALASPGRPLEPTLRQDMEFRFGHDFSTVRVHSGRRR